MLKESFEPEAQEETVIFTHYGHELSAEEKEREREAEASHRIVVHTHYVSPEPVQKPVTGETIVVVPDPEPRATVPESAAPVVAEKPPKAKKPVQSVGNFLLYGNSSWRGL